jgi:hypothetical protein
MATFPLNDRKRDFDAILVECIRQTVVDILSSQVADALFRYLETVYLLPAEAVPSRLDTLFNTLEKLFGSSGKIVEKMIVKGLYSRLSIEFDNDPKKTLLEHIEYARQEHPKRATGSFVGGEGFEPLNLTPKGFEL